MMRPSLLLLLRTKRLRRKRLRCEGLSKPCRRPPIVPPRLPHRRKRLLLRLVYRVVLRMHGLLRRPVRRRHVLSVESRGLLLHRQELLRGKTLSKKRSRGKALLLGPVKQVTTVLRHRSGSRRHRILLRRLRVLQRL